MQQLCMNGVFECTACGEGQRSFPMLTLHSARVHLVYTDIQILYTKFSTVHTL